MHILKNSDFEMMHDIKKFYKKFANTIYVQILLQCIIVQKYI